MTVYVDGKEPVVLWRCFHCRETFIGEAEAALHFGTSERESAACTIDIAEYRKMERRMHAYDEEDSELHREMHGMAARHAVELRREEEKGYAQGLHDAKLFPADVAEHKTA
jgi:hypothetical protein